MNDAIHVSLHGGKNRRSREQKSKQSAPEPLTDTDGVRDGVIQGENGEWGGDPKERQYTLGPTDQTGGAAWWKTVAPSQANRAQQCPAPHK